jgi:hypothetical protein
VRTLRNLLERREPESIPGCTKFCERAVLKWRILTLKNLLRSNE